MSATPESLIAPARLARRPVLASQRDGRLVDLVRAGHEPAFEAIVARYRGPLLRYVERFLPRERAEDAVQQAFVNAYESMIGGGSELNLRPWLYRIAHNAALNALRDRALRHGELPEATDGVERPDEALERAQGLREVLAAVQALPARQRDAIVLRELEGRSYEEIAAELGVSGGSVRQLLHRARSTLRAGASAVTPVGLVARLPWAAPSEPVAARVAELCGAAGAGAAVAKLCATALVTGAVVGGVALAPGGGDGERGVGPQRAAAEGGASGASGDGGRGGPARAASGSAGPGGSSVDDSDDRSDVRGDRERPGRRNRDDERRGPGDGEGDEGDEGDDQDRDDRGGPGDGSGEDDRNGPGDVDGDSGDDETGRGGSEASGSGSGSSGSGGGSSASGGDFSGSGSSSSGGDSSGSGSGDLLDDDPDETD